MFFSRLLSPSNDESLVIFKRCKCFFFHWGIEALSGQANNGVLSSKDAFRRGVRYWASRVRTSETS